MDTYRTLLEINNAVINCLSQAQLQEAATAIVRRIIPCDDAGLSFFAPGVEPARPPEPVLRRDGLRSQLTAPLIARGEPIGVLGVGSLEPAKYSAEDSHFFEQVAAQLALAAANVRAVERLQGSSAPANGEVNGGPASDSEIGWQRGG
jgi:transcriptional regulator with GAF, ATPase, and Fis domain